MLHKIVVHARPHWQIAWNGRSFDRFGSRDEAVMVALQWAENARAQGHRVKILLEDLGGALQPVMGPQRRTNAGRA
jgi:hypothetical protein